MSSIVREKNILATSDTSEENYCCTVVSQFCIKTIVNHVSVLKQKPIAKNQLLLRTCNNDKKP